MGREQKKLYIYIHGRKGRGLRGGVLMHEYPTFPAMNYFRVVCIEELGSCIKKTEKKCKLGG